MRAIYLCNFKSLLPSPTKYPVHHPLQCCRVLVRLYAEFRSLSIDQVMKLCGFSHDYLYNTHPPLLLPHMPRRDKNIVNSGIENNRDKRQTARLVDVLVVTKYRSDKKGSTALVRVIRETRVY